MGGDHVRDADHGGHALGLTGVVALDRLGDARVDAPAAGENAADEGVVDAELATLLGDAVVGRGAAAVEALGVARMQARQDRPADVVEDRRQGQLVAVTDSAHLGDPVGGPLHRQGVQPEAIGSEGQTPVAVEDVVGGRGAQNRLDRAGAEPLDAVGDALDAPAALDLPGGADDRAGEADIGLDDRGDLVRRGAPVHLLEGLLAALLQARLALGLVEGGGENAPAAIAACALPVYRVLKRLLSPCSSNRHGPCRLFSPCVDLPRTSVFCLRRKPLHGALDSLHRSLLS